MPGIRATRIGLHSPKIPTIPTIPAPNLPPPVLLAIPLKGARNPPENGCSRLVPPSSGHIPAGFPGVGTTGCAVAIPASRITIRTRFEHSLKPPDTHTRTPWRNHEDRDSYSAP